MKVRGPSEALQALLRRHSGAVVRGLLVLVLVLVLVLLVLLLLMIVLVLPTEGVGSGFGRAALDCSPSVSLFLVKIACGARRGRPNMPSPPS